MDIAKLTDHQAILAVRLLAARWLDQEGVVVQVALQDVQRRAAKANVALPCWATQGLRPTKASGDMCRNVLQTVATGSDARSREWARGAIARAAQPAAHVVEPLTAALAGTFLIGLILASRVKRIKAGPVEIDFYQGVPKETVEMIDKVSGAITAKR